MKYLSLFKKFNETVEIRGDSLKPEQFEDWNYILDIFIELKTDWNIVKSNVSTQERYHLGLNEKNIETFSISNPRDPFGFNNFKLKDIEYELLTFLNYLQDRLICIKINHQVILKPTNLIHTNSIKLTHKDFQKGIDFLDQKFQNIYYLYFYYKSDI